jgi:hypothetical protein
VCACLYLKILVAPHKHLDGTDRQTSYRSRNSDALSRLHAAITPGTHGMSPKRVIICTEVTHERITADEYVRSISKVSTAGKRTCARRLSHVQLNRLTPINSCGHCTDMMHYCHSSLSVICRNFTTHTMTTMSIVCTRFRKHYAVSLLTRRMFPFSVPPAVVEKRKHWLQLSARAVLSEMLDVTLLQHAGLRLVCLSNVFGASVSHGCHVVNMQQCLVFTRHTCTSVNAPSSTEPRRMTPPCYCR